MSTTVLVIGATGKTGSRVVRQLQSRNIDIRAASRRAGSFGTVFDWHDAATHAAALAGVNAVYLVLPEMVEDASSVLAPFLKLAAQAGVERIVLLSSLGITFKREPADSGRHRHEALVRASGMRWTILRPSGFYQNLSEGFLSPTIGGRDSIVTGAGQGAIAMIDADDIAAVAVGALVDDGHAGKTYALTGPEALTFAEVATTLSAVVGRPIAYASASLEQMGAMLRGVGVPDKYAAALLRDMAAMQDGEAAEVMDTVAKVTGRRATKFSEFARAAAAAWQSS